MLLTLEEAEEQGGRGRPQAREEAEAREEVEEQGGRGKPHTREEKKREGGWKKRKGFGG